MLRRLDKALRLGACINAVANQQNQSSSVPNAMQASGAPLKSWTFRRFALSQAAYRYATLDGFDLGAGIIYLLVARTEEERRAVLRSIGPVWDGNEVWLIPGGAVLFLAFPALYASSFTGFYLPLMIVLWLFMMRGIFHSNVMYPCRSGGEGLSFDS